MARHLDIADAMVTAINAAALGFTAVRKALPLNKREDLAAAAVTVTPSAFICDMGDRARIRADYSVDVAIQQAVDPDDATAFDALFELIPSIRALFELKGLSLTLGRATWLRTETVGGAEAGYAPEHLDNLRVFTAILRFTWRLIE